MDTELIVREARGDEVELLRDILVRAFHEYEGGLDPPSGVHSETLLSLQNKLRAAERRAGELGLPRVRLGVRLALKKLRAYYEARGYTPFAVGSHAGYSEPTYVEMEKAL